MAKKMPAKKRTPKRPKDSFEWLLVDVHGLEVDRCGPCTQSEAVKRLITGLGQGVPYTLQKIVDVAEIMLPESIVPPPVIKML